MKVTYKVVYIDGTGEDITIEKPAGALPDSICAVAAGIEYAERTGKTIASIGRSKYSMTTRDEIASHWACGRLGWGKGELAVLELIKKEYPDRTFELDRHPMLKNARVKETTPGTNNLGQTWLKAIRAEALEGDSSKILEWHKLPLELGKMVLIEENSLGEFLREIRRF